MEYLIGIDEAGYGPNLGPLVIGGCLWRTESNDVNLYDLLAPLLSVKPNKNSDWVVGDSKSLYHPKKGIGPLEASLLPLLFRDPLGEPSYHWSTLLDFCHEIVFPTSNDLRSQQNLFARTTQLALSRAAIQDSFYLKNFPMTLPMAAEESLIRSRQQAFQKECETKQIELHQLGGVCLMPREYNELVEEFGNKSTVLSLSSLLLVRELLGSVPSNQNIHVMCDKHGGRNRYRTLIEQTFDVQAVETLGESAEQSTYRFRFQDSHVRISFSVQGESQLPVALASMFAKYTREVLMMAWNEFWKHQVVGVEPTQGYPVDAARFLKQIQAHLPRLNIEMNSIWRVR